MDACYESGDFDYELSKRVAKSIEVVRGDCWGNAWKAVTSCSELAGALYVEGWLAIIGESGVYAHGWVEKGGRIIDPSKPQGPYQQGKFAYFPGRRFTVTEIQQTMREAGTANTDHVLPLHSRFNESDRCEFSRVREKAVEWRWSQG